MPIMPISRQNQTMKQFSIILISNHSEKSQIIQF